MSSVAKSGIFLLGGTLPIYRLGFGAMRLCGEGVWGEPADNANALAVLKEAIQLGINFIDTSDAYGPHTNEYQIAEALYPYPSGLVIATKGGLTRQGPNEWQPVGRPTYLRQCLEMSLRRLKLDKIDLWQLHRIDAKESFEEQMEELAKFVREGKVRYVGLSQVTVDELKRAREIVPIASVQNLYNLGDRSSEDLLEYCGEENIGFIPWFPVASGSLAKPGGPLDTISHETGFTPAQLSLAWLLQKSPVMLPIPGTSSIAHLKENCAAAEISLPSDVIANLENLNAPTTL